MKSGDLIHVPDAYADTQFNPAVDRATGFHTRNILACPLLGWDTHPVGVMQAINKEQGAFTDWDEVVFRTLAAQVGVAIQRQELLNELKAKHAIERELQIARMIQQRLLPRRPRRSRGTTWPGGTSRRPRPAATSTTSSRCRATGWRSAWGTRPGTGSGRP